MSLPRHENWICFKQTKLIMIFHYVYAVWLLLLILCTDCNIYYLVMYIFCNTYHVRNILYGCVIYFNIYNYAESSFHRRLCVDLLPSMRRDLNDVMEDDLDEWFGMWNFIGSERENALICELYWLEKPRICTEIFLYQKLRLDTLCIPMISRIWVWRILLRL